MAYLYFLIVAVLSFAVAVFLYMKTVETPAKIFPEFNAEKLIFIVPLLVFIPQIFLFRDAGYAIKDALFFPSSIFLSAVSVSSLLIGLCSLSDKLSKISPIMLACLCGLCAYLLPGDFSLSGLSLPLIYQKFAIAALWFFFAVGCFLFNRQEGLLSEYSIIFSFAIIIFFAFKYISCNFCICFGYFICSYFNTCESLCICTIIPFYKSIT